MPTKKELAKPSRKLSNGKQFDLDDPFYIVAQSAAADERSRVLKQGDTFAVLDHYGDINPVGMGEEGLYHEGTRFLSSLLLSLDEEHPLFLSSTVKQDNVLFTVDTTNRDVIRGIEVSLPRGTIHLFRAKFLWEGVCYERLRIVNYGLSAIDVSFSLRFAADFADIFEVRGTQRQRRGRLREPVVNQQSVELGYEGLDGVTRYTKLEFSPTPKELSGCEARFNAVLQSKGEATFFLTVCCQCAEDEPHRLSYDSALALAARTLQATRDGAAGIYSSNEQFNDWLNRSSADLGMMITQTPYGPYPYAGVPWFNTSFGRDGIITALEYLWVDPTLARGVLAYLAATQAKEVDAERDAEPGKILHETRKGEMAATGEVPFGMYYGSVDATPLFVLLAAAYYQRTADVTFLGCIWPQVEAALAWIDHYGDRDGDGFVEYFRRSPNGLVNQGWKDSHDAIFHANGAEAHGPIALVEVQGYVYAAKRGAARLAAALGYPERAAQLADQAEALEKRFESAFWCEELGTYALALDGDKHPCRVRSSNPGHCLFTQIAAKEHACLTAKSLLNEQSFSGWGIRTIASSEARYNPMSYHNGSIWPHDNAIIAAGLAHYGIKDGALKILTGLFDASLFMDLHRMPELFCGFPRRPGEGATLYPVACAPQSWAAAAVFLVLQASLGLVIDAPRRELRFSCPMLPESLTQIRITNLRVAGASTDLVLLRSGDDVAIHVARRDGQLEIIVAK